MLLSHLLADAAKVALVLGLCLAAMPLLRRASAATRRTVLAFGLTGALVLPLLSAIAPAWRVTPRVEAPMLQGFTIAERVTGDAPAPAVVPASASASASAGTSVAASPVGLATALEIAWALGALVVLSRLAVGLVRSRGMARRAAPAPAWANAARRAEEAMGSRADVRVTRELGAPAVTGVFSPVVLVPPASSSWSEERRYATLVHELAHVRQADCFAQIVAQLACALYWWNPLVWVAARRLKLERELAADDAVIVAGARPTTYAEDLLAIAGVPTDSLAKAPLGALGMAEASHLVTRVAAIVSAERARLPLSRRASAVLGAGCAGVVLATACASPRAPATEAAAATTDLSRATTSAAPAAALESSSIDPKLQAIADEELDRAMTEWRAAAGTILVLDPATGEILANAGRDKGAHADVAVRSAYVTGSTLKALTLSAALEEGVLSPTERIDCENGAFTYHGKVMHDPHANGVLSVPEMLAVSTNVGFTKVFDRLGGERLEKWFRAFHLGAAPALDGAASGQIPAGLAGKTYVGAVAAVGEGLTASPLQMAAAFGAIANGGEYVAPTASKRTKDAPRERILKAETAKTVIEMLEYAVNGEHATGRGAKVAGVRVAGKTGTAGWALPNGGEGTYASFIGFVVSPGAPRRLVLVGLEQPREEGTGGSAAAPAFSRVLARALGAR